MSYLSTGFWKFGHDCKWDQLAEPQHTHLIINALRDEETMIQFNHDGSYTLYGNQEALLVLPKLLTTRLVLAFSLVIRQSCRMVA